MHPSMQPMQPGMRPAYFHPNQTVDLRKVQIQTMFTYYPMTRLIKQEP